jgi:uncharacterized membrane protein
MSANKAEPDDGPNKGAVIKLFGVVVLALGLLNSLLSWRGGLAVSGLSVLLIGSGAYLYVIGAIRRTSDPRGDRA